MGQVTKINKIGKNYKVEVIENLNFLEHKDHVNEWICETFKDPETVMLSKIQFVDDKHAIDAINNEYDNLLFYETVCKINEICETTINDELYIGFIYATGYKYYIKKSVLKTQENRRLKVFYKKYTNARKQKKIVFR